MSAFEKCDTTLTGRRPREDCICDTEQDGQGPCHSWLFGASGNCAYCEHSRVCHYPSAPVPAPTTPVEILEAIHADLEHWAKRASEAESSLERLKAELTDDDRIALRNLAEEMELKELTLYWRQDVALLRRLSDTGA